METRDQSAGGCGSGSQPSNHLKRLLHAVPGLAGCARRIRARSAQGRRRRLLKALPKHSVGAEIGVHLGDFSRDILRVVRPVKLHLIDPWEHEAGDTYGGAWYGGRAKRGQATMDERFRTVTRRFAAEIGSGRIVVHRAHAHGLADAFEDRYFDWVYIDGNHLYEYVKLDLQRYYPKVKSNGLITGDDYGLEGWWDNGVQRAVDEFVEQRTSLSLTTMGSQFLIRKP